MKNLYRQSQTAEETYTESRNLSVWAGALGSALIAYQMWRNCKDKVQRDVTAKTKFNVT